MKFSKYLMMAGAAAMLTACSSEEPFVPTGSPMTEEIANNDSYALISLAISEDGATRSAEPVTSNIESEYKVAKGSILIFKKSKEENATDGDATFVGRFNLTSNWTDNEVDKDISRESTFTMAFPKGTFETGETYAACVVLNFPDTYPWPTTGATFNSWAQTASDVEFIYNSNGTQYLTMVSAPEAAADKSGSSVLVNIPANKIKNSITEVSAADAIDGFYVHRNAAKITLNANNAANHTFTIGSGAYKDAVVTVDGWAADVTAKESYPIQNVEGLDLTAANMVLEDADFTSFRRINWAKGAYYNATDISKAFNYASTPTKFEDKVYVKENTMNFNLQTHERTTRVLLAATYKTSATASATTLVKVGNIAELWTKDKTVEYIKSKAEAENLTEVTVDQNEASFAGGYYSLKDFCTIKSNDTEISATVYDEVAKQLGLTNASTEELAVYAGGVCYYTILVRHFDNDEAPLGTGVKIDNAGQYQAKHLGRYGVLRNNWYDITVSGISKIGEPTIPTPDSTPDDKEDDEVQALAFTINMLNWAKRSQTVTL